MDILPDTMLEEGRDKNKVIRGKTTVSIEMLQFQTAGEDQSSWGYILASS